MTSPLDKAIPTAKREAVLQAVKAAFGTDEVDAVERIVGGASQAGKFKITVQGTAYLLRIEGPPDGFRDPARQYQCMRIAAEAGIAPRLIYIDALNALAITDFIHSTRIAKDASHAQTLAAIVHEVRKLHTAPLFPRVMHYLDVVDILISYFRKKKHHAGLGGRRESATLSQAVGDLPPQ